VRPEKLVSVHVLGKAGQTNAEAVKGSVDFLALASDETIVDAVEPLIGPDIIPWGCHVFCKPAGDGHETPWHQHGHCWCDPPAGQLHGVGRAGRVHGRERLPARHPGSQAAKATRPHRLDDRQDRMLQQRMTDGSFDEGTAVDVPLQPGQLSMHAVSMIHGAMANRSRKRRTGVALRCSSACTSSSVGEPTSTNCGTPSAPHRYTPSSSRP
jgi:hypothetical protein